MTSSTLFTPAIKVSIRPHYHHVESCQETVPEAITAFLEGTDFENVIRTAVSLGGDCDTLTCIAGGIAEAFYGIDSHLKQECESIAADFGLAVEKRLWFSRDASVSFGEDMAVNCRNFRELLDQIPQV